MNPLKQSAAAYIDLGPFVDDTDSKTPETGLTISQSDVLLTKNAASIAAKSNASACSHLSAGVYRCPLAAGDTNTCGRLRVDVQKSGALPVWERFVVLPGNVYDSLIGGSDLVQVDIQQVAGQSQTAVDLAGIAADVSAIAAAATEGRLAELDSGNLPADLASIKSDTSALAARATELRLAELDAANLPLDMSAMAASLVDVHSHTSAIQAALVSLATSVSLSAVATKADAILADTSALAARATEGRLAELDAANLPADVSAIAAKALAILADTSAVAAKLPSKAYLAGSSNSDGDVQASEMTGNFPGSVASVAGAVASVTGNVGGKVIGGLSASVTVSDKTGFSLAATGLDAVDSAAPSTVAVTFREMLVMLYRRAFKKVTLTNSALTCFADNGTSAISTQVVSETSAVQTQGEAS